MPPNFNKLAEFVVAFYLLICVPHLADGQQRTNCGICCPRVPNTDYDALSFLGGIVYVGHRVYYQCLTGYDFANSIRYSLCRANGTWSEFPTCVRTQDTTNSGLGLPESGRQVSQVQCPISLIPVVKNGYVDSQSFLRNETATPGDFIRYKCRPGFNFSNTEIDYVNCTAKGQWSTAPNCSADQAVAVLVGGFAGAQAVGGFIAGGSATPCSDNTIWAILATIFIGVLLIALIILIILFCKYKKYVHDHYDSSDALTNVVVAGSSATATNRVKPIESISSSKKMTTTGSNTDPPKKIKSATISTTTDDLPDEQAGQLKKEPPSVEIEKVPVKNAGLMTDLTGQRLKSLEDQLAAIGEKAPTRNVEVMAAIAEPAGDDDNNNSGNRKNKNERSVATMTVEVAYRFEKTQTDDVAIVDDEWLEAYRQKIMAEWRHEWETMHRPVTAPPLAPPPPSIPDTPREEPSTLRLRRKPTRAQDARVYYWRRSPIVSVLYHRNDANHNRLRGIRAGPEAYGTVLTKRRSQTAVSSSAPLTIANIRNSQDMVNRRRWVIDDTAIEATRDEETNRRLAEHYKKATTERHLPRISPNNKDTTSSSSTLKPEGPIDFIDVWKGTY